MLTQLTFFYEKQDSIESSNNHSEMPLSSNELYSNYYEKTLMPTFVKFQDISPVNVPWMFPSRRAKSVPFLASPSILT